LHGASLIAWKELNPERTNSETKSPLITKASSHKSAWIMRLAMATAKIPETQALETTIGSVLK
jgi:hypothetical protein